jgi:hypothetical protein
VGYYTNNLDEDPSQTSFRPRRGHGLPYDKFHIRDLSRALEIAAYDFNITMRNSDQQTRAKLARLFDTTAHDLTDRERQYITSAMSTQLSAVEQRTVEEWHMHEGRPVCIHRLLLDHILATQGTPKGGADEVFFHVDYPHDDTLPQGAEQPIISVLRRPIGGFFNLRYSGSRLRARIWLRERATTTPLPADHKSSAIFDLRSEADAGDLWWQTTKSVERLLLGTDLPGKAFVTSTHILTFERLHLGIFVHSRLRGDRKTDPYALNGVEEGSVDDLSDLLIYTDYMKVFDTVGLTWALEEGQMLITHYFLPQPSTS